MTAVRVELCRTVRPEIELHIATALAHRATPPFDWCSACGFHHPCPAYFHARRALLAADVPPRLWAR
jgi:hypothetical protein